MFISGLESDKGGNQEAMAIRKRKKKKEKKRTRDEWA